MILCMKTNKGFVTILAIIVTLLVIGGGSYVYVESVRNDEVPNSTLDDSITDDSESRWEIDEDYVPNQSNEDEEAGDDQIGGSEADEGKGGNQGESQVEPVSTFIPVIDSIVDTTSDRINNQFVAGSTIVVYGSNFNAEMRSYNWDAFVGEQLIDYGRGSRNAIYFDTPDTLPTGQHDFYVLSSDGRKSNIADVYVLNPNAPALAPATVELLVNGSTNPDPVPLNSLVDVSWHTTGLSEYSCGASGNYVPREEGGVWTDNRNMPTSGSDVLIAAQTDGDGNYLSTLNIGISCSGSSGEPINAHVYLPVILP